MDAKIDGLKRAIWNMCNAHRGMTLHIGSLIALAGQPDHQRGDVMIQTAEERLTRLVRAMEGDMFAEARLSTESRNSKDELFTRWKVPSSHGGMWDVTILVSPTSGDVIGRSCTCEDCATRIPGWCCKHILACLISKRLPYRDPYILVSQGGFEKVKSGAVSNFTFNRGGLLRIRPEPKTIWFGANGTPSRYYVKKELVSWKPDKDAIVAEWK